LNCSWAILTTESAYKVPTATPVLGTDYTVLELLDDNPIGITNTPNTETLYSWLACGDADRGVGETATIEGTIRTLLYPAQAALLLGWAFMEVDQSVEDSEIPWITSEPAGQLASMTLDFAYRDDDGTERKNRYLGGKVTGVTLGADRGTRDGAFVLELTTAWSERTSTSATAPAAADYPSAATSPYFLSATSGNVIVNSQTISNYQSLSIAGEYTAPIVFDEDPTVKRIRHHRKDYTLTLGNRLKFTPDWRALFEARSVFGADVTLEYPGGTGQQSILFDLGDNCRMSEWTRALPINADRTQTAVIVSQFDRTAERTLAVTIGTQA
jgi:hypothetical protein